MNYLTEVKFSILRRFTILFLILHSITLDTLAQNLSGDWAFSSITNLQGVVIKPTQQTDSLFLNKSHFHYFIDSLNLEAKGSYWFYKDTLNFRYNQPKDTLRSYWIKSWSDTSFTLQEGKVFFNFFRTSPLQSNVNKSTEKGYKSIWILAGIIGFALIFIRWKKPKIG